jgi:serine/threonine protein kinase
MKRIVFDKAGLAKEVAQAEVDSLRAMAGNFWFPVLLNHFADDEEFIITMVFFFSVTVVIPPHVIFQPFYRRGDMAGLIVHKGYLGSELAQFYCTQLVSGCIYPFGRAHRSHFLQILAVQCLHKRGIIHRDIKPDNIFLDEAGHLILADLGLAENIGTFGGIDAEMDNFPIWKEAKKSGGEDFPLLWVDGVNPLGTREIAGTYWYTAPEVFRNERYSFGVDYYSVGVVYCELVTGNVSRGFSSVIIY